jgi:hypothetical protein
MATKPYSVAAWINLTTVTGIDQYIFLMFNDTGYYESKNRNVMGVFSGGDLIVAIKSFGAGDPTDAWITKSGVGINQWVSVIGIWASTSSRSVSLNGGALSTDTVEITALDLDSTRVSVQVGGGANVSGLFGPYVVYNKALSQAEVTSIGSTKIDPRLVAPDNILEYWDFFGRNSPERGLLGYRDVTLVNTPSHADDYPPVILPTGVL